MIPMAILTSKRLTFLSAAAFSLTLMQPVAAQDVPNVDTVVANVDGVEITLGHMLQTRQTLPAQYQQLPPETLFNGILDQLIQQTALSNAAGEAPKSVQISIENYRRAQLANVALEAVLAAAITEDVIKDAYEAQYANQEPTKEYNAAHILVETQEEALQLTEKARGGADFAELAKEHSTGPSGPNGGALGWFGAGMMVPAFEQATTELEVGGISEPVQTQFGWHVIKLNETRDMPVPALEEVRDAIVAELEGTVINAEIAKLTSEVTVDRSAADALDPTVLNTLSFEAN
jgi:peptidyl-prolyl cis-trans isomerase C